MYRLVNGLCYLWTLASFISSNGVLGELQGQGIIGGRDIEHPHEFPYLVSFQNSTLAHWCGGSIIGDQFILTAAHCVIENEIDFRKFPHNIVAGVDDLNDENQDTKVLAEVEKIYVSNMYNHSWWTSVYAIHDWAVLKLKTKLDIENNVGLKIINLPEKKADSDEYSDYAGETATLASFGNDYIKLVLENGQYREVGNSSGKVHKARIIVIDHEACQSLFQNKPTNSQICARVSEHEDNTHQGVCSGDSGSALTIGNTVIGITSTSGFGCNDNWMPSVYTRVSSFVADIRNAMNDITDGLRVGVATTS